MLAADMEILFFFGAVAAAVVVQFVGCGGDVREIGYNIAVMQKSNLLIMSKHKEYGQLTYLFIFCNKVLFLKWSLFSIINYFEINVLC